MNNLDFLATGQIERIGKKIRGQLTNLRRRKLIHLARSAPNPPRNPALDPLATQLQQMRLRLEFQIRKVESESNRNGAEDQAMARARTVLADATEIVDLVIWFGAELPDDVIVSKDSNSRKG